MDLFVLMECIDNFFPRIVNTCQSAPLQRRAGLGNKLIDAECDAPEFSFAFRVTKRRIPSVNWGQPLIYSLPVFPRFAAFKNN